MKSLHMLTKSTASLSDPTTPASDGCKGKGGRECLGTARSCGGFFGSCSAGWNGGIAAGGEREGLSPGPILE